MLTMILSYWKLAAITAVAVALTFSHIYVYNKGKENVLNKLSQERIKVLKDGQEIDKEVLEADDPYLCGLLGGCGVLDN